MEKTYKCTQKEREGRKKKERARSYFRTMGPCILWPFDLIARGRKRKSNRPQWSWPSLLLTLLLQHLHWEGHWLLHLVLLLLLYRPPPPPPPRPAPPRPTLFIVGCTLRLTSVLLIGFFFDYFYTSRTLSFLFLFSVSFFSGFENRLYKNKV